MRKVFKKIWVLVMFKNLSDRLIKTVGSLRQSKKLNEKNMASTLKDIKKALIEADVALSVVKKFIREVKIKATGQNIIKRVKANEALIKIVSDQLITTLGEKNTPINLKATPPVVILMAGLQGSGKTTTTAKLALLLKQTENKSVLVASVDIYRPAAMEQLKTLSEQIDTPYFESSNTESPLKIAKAAVAQAKKQHADVIIIDTAGRNHVDNELMTELKQIENAVNPSETLLVVDSMAGQDAANMAREFNQAIDITGIVLTKTDGDSRGGAALSMSMITEKPIKLMGTGEKIEALEPFHPNRIASRILGQGDIVSLVEEAERKIDKKEMEKLSKKIKKGQHFDLNDFLSQLRQMKKMGGIEQMLKKIPGAGNLPTNPQMMDDNNLQQMEVIISSMTAKERTYPAIINSSRKKRISKGSGTQPIDTSKLLKKFEKMKKTMQRMKGQKMMKRMNKMRDHLPPELLNQLPDDLK
jgi:signal recognition particle subunit SRP54